MKKLAYVASFILYIALRLDEPTYKTASTPAFIALAYFSAFPGIPTMVSKPDKYKSKSS